MTMGIPELEAIERGITTMTREELELRTLNLSKLLIDMQANDDVRQKQVIESLKTQYWALWVANIAMKQPMGPKTVEKVDLSITNLNKIADGGTFPEFTEYVRGMNKAIGAHETKD